MVSTQRFASGARWVHALISPTGAELFPLTRVVRPSSAVLPTSDWTVTFDASVYGGGAFIRNDQAITEWFAISWSSADLAVVAVEPGNPRHQTFFELLTLLLALIQWGDFAAKESILTLVGDNTGSLQEALSLRGKGSLNLLSKELACRQAKHQWKFAVGHLPTEANKIADALSRLPQGAPLPRELANATKVQCIGIANLWTTLSPPPLP